MCGRSDAALHVRVRIVRDNLSDCLGQLSLRRLTDCLANQRVEAGDPQRAGGDGVNDLDWITVEWHGSAQSTQRSFSKNRVELLDAQVGMRQARLCKVGLQKSLPRSCL